MAARKPEETPDALRAFEDYWALGDARSLPKLAEVYRQRSENGEPVPTKRPATLADWSTQHGWQQRCKDRIAEEAERVREENRKRVRAYRNRLMLAIEADSSLYAQKVSKGEAVLAEDAASLERMTKLYFQLAEEPLADRHELTGAAGGPVQVEAGPSVLAIIQDPEAAALASSLVARLSEGAQPEPDHEPEGPDEGAA